MMRTVRGLYCHDVSAGRPNSSADRAQPANALPSASEASKLNAVREEGALRRAEASRPDAGLGPALWPVFRPGHGELLSWARHQAATVWDQETWLGVAVALLRCHETLSLT